MFSLFSNNVLQWLARYGSLYHKLNLSLSLGNGILRSTAFSVEGDLSICSAGCGVRVRQSRFINYLHTSATARPSGVIDDSLGPFVLFHSTNHPICSTEKKCVGIVEIFSSE